MGPRGCEGARTGYVSVAADADQSDEVRAKARVWAAVLDYDLRPGPGTLSALLAAAEDGEGPTSFYRLTYGSPGLLGVERRMEFGTALFPNCVERWLTTREQEVCATIFTSLRLNESSFNDAVKALPNPPSEPEVDALRKALDSWMNPSALRGPGSRAEETAGPQPPGRFLILPRGAAAPGRFARSLLMSQKSGVCARRPRPPAAG